MKFSLRTSPLSMFALTVASDKPAVDDVPGVSLELAEHRAELISEINYRLTLDIPEDRDADIDSRLIGQAHLEGLLATEISDSAAVPAG